MKLEQKVLLKAADYIAEHGWTQGRHEDSSGAVCALGAIAKAITPRWDADYFWGHSTKSPGYYLAQSAAALLSSHVSDGIASWNDNPNTSAEDVILALKGAANSDA